VGGTVAGDVGRGTGQVDAGGETHEVADHVSGQASVDLDEAGPAVDEAHLYVADAVGDAEGVDRRPGGRRDGLPERVVGVHTVGQLLEVRRRADGLAVDRHHRGGAAVGDTLHGDLRPVEELLDEDAGALGALTGRPFGRPVGGRELVSVIDAEHADGTRV